VETENQEQETNTCKPASHTYVSRRDSPGVTLIWFFFALVTTFWHRVAKRSVLRLSL
jgi:hypothetical protein